MAGASDLSSTLPSARELEKAGNAYWKQWINKVWFFKAICLCDKLGLGLNIGVC